MAEITKEDVLNAMQVIDQYTKQERKKLEKLGFETNLQTDKRPVSCLDLGRREFNLLNALGISKIGELLNIGVYDLRRYRNVGEKSIKRINQALKDKGIDAEPFVW